MTTAATLPATPDPNTKPANMSLKGWLASPELAKEIAKALPKHLTPDRMLRVATTSLMRVKHLADCSPPSFLQCLMNCSAWGLEPDGRLAHLIPFYNNKLKCYECQLIIDYKGLVALAYRSGQVKSIHADVVREGDVFEYSMGEVSRHTPWDFRTDASKPKEPGKVIAAYARVVMQGDVAKCEVMTQAEIEGIRKRSKAGTSGPWCTDWNEMAKKTVFRRVSKWLPLSAEIQAAFDTDDDKLPAISHNPPRIEATDGRLAELLQAHVGDDDADDNQASDPQDN